LSFEEFYKLLKTKENLFKSVITRYYELFRIQNPEYRYPTAMIIISIAQALCFWIDKKKECALGQVFKYCTCNGGDIWRMFFYMFIHEDSSILVMNIMIQLLIAVALESRHSWWKVTIVYFSGGIGSALGHTTLSQSGYLIGASAGVYALISANFAFVVMVIIIYLLILPFV
jgi:rhomboid-related protein 1/2/3